MRHAHVGDASAAVRVVVNNKTRGIARGALREYSAGLDHAPNNVRAALP